MEHAMDWCDSVVRRLAARRRHVATLARVFGGCLVGGVIATSAWALDAARVTKMSFLDLKQDAVEAAASGKTLMLLFEQEGCSYCVQLRRVNLADAEVAGTIRSNFDLVALDIWGAREVTDFAGARLPEKQYARMLNVQMTPMIVFLGSDGKELFRMAGYYKLPVFKAALRYVAGRYYEKTSFRDFARTSATGTSPVRRSDAPFLQTTTDLPTSLGIAAQRGKGLALVFEQPQCPDCAELHDRTFRDPRVIELLTGAFDVAVFDIFGARNVRLPDGTVVAESRMAERFDIRYTPTIVFLDQHGREIFRTDSYRRPEHYAVLPRYVASGAYKQYASFQDWLRAQRTARPASPPASP